MPETLKRNDAASIYYNSHKPYNWFRSFTSVNGAGIGTHNASVAAVSTHRCYCWWGTFRACGDSRCRWKFVGYLGQGYADFAVRSISTTQMGPTPDHKEEDLHHEKPSLPSKSEKLLTLPTVTKSHVAVVPLLVTTFYVNSWWGLTATTAIFIATTVTNWLDGYLAHKMNLGTAFGVFLDPVADKLMVAATLVLL